MFGVTAADYTAEGMATVVINRRVPVWEMPRATPSRATASGSASRGFRTLITSLLASVKSPLRSYLTSTEMAVWSVSTTQWLRTVVIVSARSTGMCVHLPHAEFSQDAC